MSQFPPLHKGVDFPDVEIREMACRTGCSTASAAQAQPDRRFDCVNEPGHFPVIRIEINLPVFTDRIAKGFHTGFILNRQRPEVLWTGRL
jgi:hypothetical protein